MEEAGVAEGAHRSPKGLWHSFGVHDSVSGVPLNMLLEVDGAFGHQDDSHLRQRDWQGRAGYSFSYVVITPCLLRI